MKSITLTLPYPISANRNSPCIPAEGCLNAQGYGHVRHNGRVVRANRLAYVTAHGLELSDIAGVVIRHVCDNPACVNPDHLEPGTHTDNMRDMMARGRGRQPKGVHNARSKLTDDEVRSIRRRVANGEDRGHVASDFGINRSQVCRIFNRKSWGHVK